MHDGLIVCRRSFPRSRLCISPLDFFLSLSLLLFPPSFLTVLPFPDRRTRRADSLFALVVFVGRLCQPLERWLPIEQKVIHLQPNLGLSRTLFLVAVSKILAAAISFFFLVASLRVPAVRFLAVATVDAFDI